MREEMEEKVAKIYFEKVRQSVIEVEVEVLPTYEKNDCDPVACVPDASFFGRRKIRRQLP